MWEMKSEIDLTFRYWNSKQSRGINNTESRAIKLSRSPKRQLSLSIHNRGLFISLRRVSKSRNERWSA
jgi:hypothetical protein